MASIWPGVQGLEQVVADPVGALVASCQPTWRAGRRPEQQVVAAVDRLRLRRIGEDRRVLPVGARDPVVVVVAVRWETDELVAVVDVVAGTVDLECAGVVAVARAGGIWSGSRPGTRSSASRACVVDGRDVRRYCCAESSRRSSAAAPAWRRARLRPLRRRSSTCRRRAARRPRTGGRAAAALAEELADRLRICRLGGRHVRERAPRRGRRGTGSP